VWSSGQTVTPGAGPALWLGISGLYLVMSLHARYGTERLDSATVRRELDAGLHAGWMRTQKDPLTRVLIGLLVATSLAQLLSPGSSAEAAGMLPEAVWRGDWWRLLSYGVMHANPIHLGLNLLALRSLGKLMEVHASRALLAPVLLAGILGGGVAGLLLGPPVPMVGVSGGLLALIGFLTLVGFRRKDRLPGGFARTMLMDLVFIGAVGLAGFRVIANAGHLGGLLVGLALGALLVPRPAGEPRVGWKVGWPTRVIGWMSTVLLAATCVGTAALLFANR
jgi:membrane associated rhomboid family serine protease